jgi:hypothetical protein
MSRSTMNSHHEPIVFDVRQCGAAVRSLFDGEKQASITAVFNATFYVEIDGRLACIGSEGLGASPLNLCTTAPAGTDWQASGLRANAVVRMSAGIVRVHPRISIKLNDPPIWRPAPVRADWTATDLRHGLSIFREASEGLVPAQGLGCFVFPEGQSRADCALGRFACVAVRGLREWLQRSLRGPNSETADGLQWVHRLIGLGPGLTPSGDDFIAGMLVALRALGEDEVCDRLWASVRRRSWAAGNAISSTHLEIAAGGQASDAVHKMLNAIMAGRGDEITMALRGIDDIGHTSGWDTMSGIVVVLHDWLEIPGRH